MEFKCCAEFSPLNNMRESMLPNIYFPWPHKINKVIRPVNYGKCSCKLKFTYILCLLSLTERNKKRPGIVFVSSQSLFNFFDHQQPNP